MTSIYIWEGLTALLFYAFLIDPDRFSDAVDIAEIKIRQFLIVCRLWPRLTFQYWRFRLEVWWLLQRKKTGL
jgi:hypothetical protein